MIVAGACPTGKIGYLDEITALLSLQDLSISRDNREKTERSVYPCGACGMHHLTSWRIDD